MFHWKIFILFSWISNYLALLKFVDSVFKKSDVIVEEFKYDSNYRQLCNSDSYPLLKPFIDEQWYKARKALNLHGNYSHKPRHKSYMTQMFYSIQRGIFVYHINNTLIAYLRIPKTGSESIMRNLRKYMIKEGFKKRKNKRHPFIQFSQNKTEFNMFKSNMKLQSVDNFSGFHKPILLSTEKFRRKNSNVKVFSYIRDPISRLESGWAEAISLNYEALKHTFPRNITLNLFRQWYTDILNYKNARMSHPIYALDHIYPMSGSFFRFDVDILLAQEYFLDNWENVVVPTYNLQPNAYNGKEGVHKSSIHHPDVKEKGLIIQSNNSIQYTSNSTSYMLVYEFRNFFRTLPSVDPSLWQAICHLILIDYVCFPQYQLPKSCQNLQNEVDHGRSLLMKKK